MHMDKRFIEDLAKKWETKVHDAAKRTATPEAIKALQTTQPQSIQERLSAFDWRVMQMNRNASNQVGLAGFFQAKSLERNRVIDGKPVNDRLVVLLRQMEDSDKCISIRWYSRNLEPLANMLRRGLQISVSGEVQLDVKAVDAPDPETGVAPVSKVPFKRAERYKYGCSPMSHMSQGYAPPQRVQRAFLGGLGLFRGLPHDDG